MPRKPSVDNQNERIQEETDRLNAILKDVPQEKLSAAQELIERVAFMTVTLEILEEDIKAKGPIVTFKNGKQIMRVENPSQKTYNTMINRYTTAYDKLLNLLPKNIKNEDDDNEFDDF
ncbi:hypothetical protein [Priestia aryabhattai]|uniref:hypothetical protein n=1 Tax=Priestia aryabhattai TaxID=412384 RepID=UPI003C990F8E